MENIVHLFVIVPVIGFLLSLIISESREALLSKVVFYTIGLNLIVSMGFVIYWVADGAKNFNLHDWTVYSEGNFNFFIDFYFDEIAAVYLLVGNIISFMVSVYSRYYMHKESGYKRFFNTILFFYIGYIITVLSGNFETLFIGWEILGISSFLLIAFYRLRYLPVKNALKVFTIYRIGDVGILLAMWMSHHLWHENITFFQLNNYELVNEHLTSKSEIGIFISLMLLVAALAKSAQLPFTAWLPRAMEGPTPSSAIFYGSLSVHIGAFLLMRTFPFWEHQILVRWLIGGMGLLTAVITTMIARVQPTVKGQVAYSSSAQIGIIFIEIAAGFYWMALIHFVGNAFLRTYQLLVSPSVVTYLVREQFYTYEASEIRENPRKRLNRFKSAMYLMAVKEWNLDTFIFKIIFKPLKQLRYFLGFLSLKSIIGILLPLYLAGVYVAYSKAGFLADSKDYLAGIAGLLALMMVMKAYNERSSSRLAWLLLVFAHFFIDLAVTFNDHLDLKEAGIYLSGVALSGILGYWMLYRVRAFEKHRIGLNSFHGLVDKHPISAFVFLLACLGLTGFPITTTFFGEDLILTHIKADQYLLATLVSLTFIILGIAVIRIYTRVFLGSFTKNYQHPTELSI
ncbi:proton-conducting transporter transmembrane domain-containing protein [Cyclobacterium jeungdonense]|uniref:Proton-conducting transporter membrane subunit n=1 Tax=Cyclobacterium jeungdonense TaxID=708087 RepID=A0ABT8C532_9BACT|nr:proton-conducting transporter membrane subunit [Cyclobacterium jeungdonense]MDN3687575.1 proton-conducting transporter membrane subunit [Cyclobacterium jeungdonense]